MKHGWLDTDDGVEITDLSHDHDKSSSSSNSSSGNSIISNDESHKVQWKNSDNEIGGSVSEVITVISMPSQNVPFAGDAMFMGYIANVIVKRRI